MDKHALVSFLKTSNSTRPSDSCHFQVLQKPTRAIYIHIALETMLLPIQNTIYVCYVKVAYISFTNFLISTTFLLALYVRTVGQHFYILNSLVLIIADINL